MSKARIGANDAYLVGDCEKFYIVEEGYVDLFAVLTDSRQETLTRSPFVVRIMPGEAIFGSPFHRAANSDSGEEQLIVFEAVPSRNASLYTGDRNRLVRQDDFDIDAIVLIDGWLNSLSNFVSSKEPPPLARDLKLLEADPDVMYKQRSAVSAHHLEVLWVKADQQTNYVGLNEFPVRREEYVPLTEHTWLNLPVDASVSATHTPGAIVQGWMWEAFDRFNSRILSMGEHYWNAEIERSKQYASNHRQSVGFAQGSLTRNLASLLGDMPELHRSGAAELDSSDHALRMAADIVADSVGAQIEPLAFSENHGDDSPLERARELVEASGIRTRRVALKPGWETRDGSSFLGFIADDKESRPVAVINRGGAYELSDPAGGEVRPVDRGLAQSLESWGLVFYAPLPDQVKSGLDALLHVFRGRSRDIWGVVLMGCLGALVALLTPVMTGELLAVIIPRVDIPMWGAALGALAFGAFSSAAFAVVGAFYMLRIEARVDQTLQAAVWSRLLSLPLPFFGRYLAGDLADRANGVSLIRQVLTGATGSSVLSGVFSLFSYALLFYYSWELALWAGATVLVLAAATWFFASQQIRHNRAAFMAQGLIDGVVFQIIRGITKLRQANAEVYALNNWSKQYVEQKGAQLKARQWAAGQLAFNALFGPFAQIILLGMIWYTLISGVNPTTFSLADFLSFYAAFGQFVGGVTGLTAAWVTVITVLPLFERIQPILEAKPESPEGRVNIPSPQGQIEFRNACFRYPSSTGDVLSDVTLRIAAGEYVAFVGPSGAGKSTIYRLILGFEHPSSGTVMIDGYDLTTLNLSSMRKHMGVVLQNGQLVPDTIHSNISGDLGIDDDEVWEALRAVGLEEDIRAMPMKLNSVISEAGAGLSGGQIQRLLVARALARKPAILLFDEATSMLDNRSQDMIKQTLRGLTSTRVVIAHRLSTVTDADRIIVMREGRIVESGKYQELMERDGVMAEMARRQLI